LHLVKQWRAMQANCWLWRKARFCVISFISAEEVVDESIEVLKTPTRFVMSVMTSEPDSGCHYWPITPPEKYTGPWNHTLNNRVLIHSNLVCALNETLTVCLFGNSWIPSRLYQMELLLRRYWMIRLPWYWGKDLG
jgi:hypothetical protein